MPERLIIDSFPAWKAVLWCLYPMAVLVFVEIIFRVLRDDDDDFGGGKMIGALQPVRSR